MMMGHGAGSSDQLDAGQAVLVMPEDVGPGAITQQVVTLMLLKLYDVLTVHN